MMRRLFLLIILYLFLLVPALSAAAWDWPAIVASSGGAGGSTTVDYIQDFEGTGAPTNWSKSGAGTIDWDYLTAPFEGLQSAYLWGSTVVTYDPNLDAQEIWISLYCSISNITTARNFFSIIDNSGSTLGYATLVSTGEVTLYHGTAYSISAPGALAKSSNHTIKMHAKVSSGADDGIFALYKWNGASWDLLVEVTTGTSTVNMDRFLFIQTSYTGIVKMDYVKVHSADISSPD